MTELDTLLDDWATWNEERIVYSEHDGMRDGPSASQWQNSDDEAFSLLDRAIELLKEMKNGPPHD